MLNKHQSKKGEANTVPVVNLAYTFMSEASGQEHKEVGMPIIAVTDRNPDYTFGGMDP